MGREHREEDGVAVRGRVRDQFGAAAVGAAGACKVGCLLFGCIVRLPVADPTHDVGVAGAVTRADHVQHRRVPVVAAAAEDAAGREEALEPARLAGMHLPLLHLVEPGSVQALRRIVGRQRHEVGCDVFESRLALLCVHR